MTQETFWKPEPKEPWADWRTYSMLLPILSGATGACLFMALGFAFAEIAGIPAGVRTPLVLAASFTVAFGSSFGSVGSGIEVFRKAYTKQAVGWDWTSLVISILTTVAGFAMGFAALLGATADWSRLAVIYGSLVVGTLAALDSGGDMIELGGLFGSFEQRYENWLTEKQAWLKETGQSLTGETGSLTEQIDTLTKQIADLKERQTWPTATAADLKRITANLNGGRANLDRESLDLILAEHHLNLPSDSTIRRGLRE